jgi:hypothetical protein
MKTFRNFAEEMEANLVKTIMNLMAEESPSKKSTLAEGSDGRHSGLDAVLKTHGFAHAGTTSKEFPHLGSVHRYQKGEHTVFVHPKTGKWGHQRKPSDNYTPEGIGPKALDDHLKSIHSRL